MRALVGIRLPLVSALPTCALPIYPLRFAEHVKTRNPHHQVALPRQRFIAHPVALLAFLGEIGRASCRESVFQFYAAEVSQVGRNGIVAPKLLPADVAALGPIDRQT